MIRNSSRRCSHGEPLDGPNLVCRHAPIINISYLIIYCENSVLVWTSQESAAMTETAQHTRQWRHF